MKDNEWLWQLHGQTNYSGVGIDKEAIKTLQMIKFKGVIGRDAAI